MTSVFRLVLLGMGLMLSLSSVTEADEVVGRVVDFKNAGYFGVLGKQDGRTVFLYARLKEVACPSTEQERERDTMMQGDDDQRQGRAANDFTRGLVGEQTVTVHFDRLEPDGISCFARVTLEDGRDVGRELLKAGLGWLRDPRNADAELVALQSEARRSGEGIWSERWYKDLGPLWWKILCGIGVLFLLLLALVLLPLLGELLLLAVVWPISLISGGKEGESAGSPAAEPVRQAPARGANREIERLKMAALADAEEYKGSQSAEDVPSALASYQRAEKHYAERIMASTASDDDLDVVWRELISAVETAPGNAWLFDRCLQLLGQVGGSVKESHPEWSQQCQNELGQRWPEMLDSFEKCRSARKGGRIGLLDHIGRQSGGHLPTLPQGQVERARQAARQKALAAVQACRTNPEAWFQLSYQFFASGEEAYSKELDEVVDALKEAHGASLGTVDNSDEEA
ncbi:MAG: thermonuclease family protein [Planctomycetes bacterium]|nr:thermonuclease family protein [Planctomycetota bacterium]